MKARYSFLKPGSLAKAGSLETAEKNLYILDLATGKVILECSKDLRLPEVEKFLLLEDSLVLECSNKIMLAKFWI